MRIIKGQDDPHKYFVWECPNCQTVNLEYAPFPAIVECEYCGVGISEYEQYENQQAEYRLS